MNVLQISGVVMFSMVILQSIAVHGALHLVEDRDDRMLLGHDATSQSFSTSIIDIILLRFSLLSTILDRRAFSLALARPASGTILYHYIVMI